MKLKKQLVVLVTMFILLSFPTIAYALNYNVNAYNNSSLGLNSYGNYGQNYVMANPTITNCHVNSIFVHEEQTLNPNAVECGWYCKTVGGIRQQPKFFGVWTIEGVYHQTDFENASYDSNHSFEIQNVLGTNWWRWYIDGVQKLAIDMGGWKYGTSRANSERQNLNETNYAHFWNLRSKNSQGYYYDWSNLQKHAVSNDPQYILNKISNTECYVQLP